MSIYVFSVVKGDEKLNNKKKNKNYYFKCFLLCWIVTRTSFSWILTRISVQKRKFSFEIVHDSYWNPITFVALVYATLFFTDWVRERNNRWLCMQFQWIWKFIGIVMHSKRKKIIGFCWDKLICMHPLYTAHRTFTCFHNKHQIQFNSTLLFHKKNEIFSYASHAIINIHKTIELVKIMLHKHLK